MWEGGISFEPYNTEFNNNLKLEIRERDCFTCQECYLSEKELGFKLDVHHIDYNKNNNNKENLISLCRMCHAQTNYNRDIWEKWFKQLIHNNRQFIEGRGVQICEENNFSKNRQEGKWLAT